MAASKTSSQTSRSDSADTTSASAASRRHGRHAASLRAMVERVALGRRSVAMADARPAGNSADEWRQRTDGAPNPFAALNGAPGAVPFTIPPMPDFTKLGTIPDFSSSRARSPACRRFPASTARCRRCPRCRTPSIPPERLQQLQSDYSRDVDRTAQAGERAEHRSGGAEGSPLQHDGMAIDAGLCVHRRVVPAQRALSAGTGRRGRNRSEDARAHPLHRAAMDGRRLAEQLPRAQSRSAEDADREQGREHRQGMMNLLNDMQRGQISQTDESRFVVGAKHRRRPKARSSSRTSCCS